MTGDLPANLAGHFDRRVVIGLNRIDAFYRRIGYRYGSGIDVFPAIDARKCPPPAYWGDEIPALWACGESHRQVICRALSDGIERIAIFEDDCAFVPSAAKALVEFMREVPDDWQALMLGGQVSVHDGKTTPITPKVSKCVQVERLHAYVLNREGMRIFHDALCEPTSVANDYRFGDLQEQGKLITYRIEPFIAYQVAGESSISGRVEANRIWDERVDVRLRKPEDVKIIALVCPFAVMEELRARGIISNGGESPPFMELKAPGRVEEGENRIADIMLRVWREHPDVGMKSAEALRSDCCFHEKAVLALWHYTEFTPHPNAVQIRAKTLDDAIKSIQSLPE
jgi:GR25 family glycosyltransferase involved in LPS biosynthesis